MSACAGARQTTKSDSASSSSSATWRSRPPRSSIGCGVAASTRMPKREARGRRAARRSGPRPIDAERRAAQLAADEGRERPARARPPRRSGRCRGRDRSSRRRSTRRPPATKPGLACVTSTPCALAAATSTVRMSTAQRMKANELGELAKERFRPGRLPVGDQRVAAARGGDERGQRQLARPRR